MRLTQQQILEALDNLYEETDQVNDARIRLEEIREHVDQLLAALDIGAKK